MKVRRILAPLDGSENSFRSLKNALELAGQCNATVIGLHVITDMSLFTAAHAIVVESKKWPTHVRDFMKEARHIAEKKKAHYEELVIGGKTPGYDITVFADSKSNAIDLIVIGRRGLNLPKEILLGSTTNYVVHKSKTPVLVTK